MVKLGIMVLEYFQSPHVDTKRPLLLTPSLVKS